MSKRKYLIGTIYETFLQLVFTLKKQQITKVEFEILNNPKMMLNGEKVMPANGFGGKGSEFMTMDPVNVKILNWQLLAP